MASSRAARAMSTVLRAAKSASSPVCVRQCDEYRSAHLGVSMSFFKVFHSDMCSISPLLCIRMSLMHVKSLKEKKECCGAGQRYLPGASLEAVRDSARSRVPRA